MTGLPIPLDEGMSDEQLAGQRWLERRVPDAAAGTNVSPYSVTRSKATTSPRFASQCGSL